MPRFRVVATAWTTTEGVAFITAKDQRTADDAAERLKQADFEWGVLNPIFEEISVDSVEPAD